MDDFTYNNVIGRRHFIAKMMKWKWVRYLFGRFIFKDAEQIVTELVENPPEALSDIMECWRMRSDINRAWGRRRAEIRIMRYYCIRDSNYPYTANDHPHTQRDFVESICDEIEDIIHD